MIALFAALLCARALAAGNLAVADDGQPQGERFVCTAVPAGADLSCPVDTDNRVQSASPQEDEFRSTIVQLRETVLQQRETIASQQNTIKELNSKLSRCEAAAQDARDSKWRGGARRKDFGKNTMGDLPRDPAETIEQLGKTMQGLKDRLENLEQQLHANASGAPFPNELRDLLKRRLGDLESQLLRRVAELEEEKTQLYNETIAHRKHTENTLNSLLERITELERSNSAFKSPEDFKVSLPLRTNYLYGRIKKSLPEMYAFTMCMWLKSSASPGIGTPFSYGVPGQANEIVLIEWGNNPIELLVNDKNFIPDRSRPGLTTTAIGAVDLQGAGGNWTTVGRRSRGGRRVRREREKRKSKSVGLRIETLNVGTMTGKGRELADVMERRKVDILCVQETRWKGSKARSIGAGFKLFYYGVDSKRNGVGVILKEEFVRNVLEVKRVSDRVMSLKLEIEGVMLNVVSGYAPQVGCELEEKERFWSELDEVMESIPTGERVVIGADFNEHVGEGNAGDEEVMGKFGVKERNLEGQMVVDFAKRMDMGVVNTYFQKREEHRVTYKSGGRRTQVDYILCRRGNLKEISDCKVVVGESVARQHRMVVCRMTLMVCKTKRSKREIEKKTKWWKLKKEECCEEFRQKLRQALGGQVVLPDDWETTAEVIRETGRKVLGVSSGRRKEDKETWWWNEEVQDSIQRKRLAKKKWDMDRTEENRQEYKELQRRVKREVSKAKQKAYDELYTRLDTREGEKDLYRLARQRDRDGKDVQQVRVIKDRDGRVLTSEESVQRRWKEYFEELMNEENEREKRVEGVNSGTENLEKAYDRVPREELWYCMRKSGVAEKYVRVVQDMYERSRTVVRCAVGQTVEFKVEVGLHQGSALSPFLFVIVMDQLSEEVRQESPWTMMFADDIVICSESREQVEENLERWRFALERRGMNVSPSKTEYMCVNEREGSGTVRLQGEEVKKVQEFKYLGSTVQSNGECGKEVAQLPLSVGDGRWHHICITWTTRDGFWEAYQDGERLGTGENLAPWHPIKPGGVIILGQEQDIVGGRFDATQAFVGELSHFNMWDRVLRPTDISGMANCSAYMPGNVVPWIDTNVEVFGGATKAALEICEDRLFDS
ncbi:hypothetical protein QTP70_024045 [Hemibagrus guttatus]|uniref:ribonuclease H n=2 Tax=Hemibagrus guttatus TaxID=175788 RepID=A0AAE0QGD4_9TELE|nr:hypothetical protein QTP70_024045 [Hemibagrus guttatus]KAK3552777.1 hypothetical protein QTP86_022600 [Hemibagrus guttatus]